MSYELFSTGEENEYLAFSEGEFTQDQMDRDHEKELEDIFDYIDQFKEIVKNENEYADYVTANNAVVEYREVFVENQSSPNEELIARLGTLENVIINLVNKLKEQEEQIPLSEKKLLTVKDFEMLYSIPEETQRRLRGRLKDSLPFRQFKNRGNVYYEPKKVDKWMENYDKER